MIHGARTSNRSDSRHSRAILALLVRFIRRYWPDTRIVFRGDSGFYRPRLLSWCDRNSVDYLVGISKNSRLILSGFAYTLFERLRVLMSDSYPYKKDLSDLVQRLVPT